MQLPKLTSYLRRLPWKERVPSAVILVSLTCWPSSAPAQAVGDASARPSTIPTQRESHIGSLTGHAKDGAASYRRYCIGCHGERGDGEGENANWINPKPRDFTLATFKCRSTPTGTLPTDEDLFNTIGRGLANSNMPVWISLSRQQRVDLVAYVKTFSPRWQTEKPGAPIKIPAESAVTIESISHGKSLYQKLECSTCHGSQGKGDGPAAATLTDSKDRSDPALRLFFGRQRFAI